MSVIKPRTNREPINPPNLPQTPTKKQVISQGFTFLVAGYETTSAATALALFLLATHPQVHTGRWQWGLWGTAVGAAGHCCGASGAVEWRWALGP